MTRFVVDASVAVKWIVDEGDSEAAAAVLHRCPMAAPDLLVAECSNILWKKVRRNELTRKHAILGARLLQGAPIELLPTRHLVERATALAIDLDHPAYDCVYLALALDNTWPFVTADRRLRRALDRLPGSAVAASVISMEEAVARQMAAGHESDTT